LTLSELCSLTWFMMVRNADETERQKVKANLWRPPKGVVPVKESPWSAENEMGALKALKASLGGTATSR